MEVLLGRSLVLRLRVKWGQNPLRRKRVMGFGRPVPGAMEKGMFLPG